MACLPKKSRTSGHPLPFYMIPSTHSRSEELDQTASSGWSAHKEALFAALMRMEERALVQHVRTAPHDDLPDAVLARAYREFWLADRFDEAEAVATRLFGGRPDLDLGETEPEYMRWLLVLAFKFARNSPSREGPDLYQSALRQIVRKLLGSQGAQAHTAWKPFCYDRLFDAWRERTRKDPKMVGLEVEDSSSRQPVRLVDKALEYPWQGSVAADREEELTSFLEARLRAEAKDPRVLEIGLDQFFGDESPIDVADPERPNRRPLTERLNLSRFQVHRRKSKAELIIRLAMEEWTERSPRL
jgi:hypothetical protein